MAEDSAETASGIAIVVPCRNEASTIRRLLDALAVQTRTADRIVIVDDRSSDGTAAAIRAWSERHPDARVTVAEGAGRGAGPAMNIGIREVDASVIVRLDGHCRPDPHYVERCLETLDLPGAGVAGGVWRIEPGARSLAARGIAAVLSHPLGSGGAEYRRPPESHTGQPVAVDTVPFGTFRRATWEAVGGFDETLLRNQDYDFNYRVRLQGHRILLNPAIVSTYTARSSFRALARQYYGYGFWKVVMLRKFPASLRARQALPLMLAPVLAGLTILTLAGQAWALLLLAGYLTANAAGALQAASRVRDLRAAAHASIALVVLQNAWSAGAWASLIRGGRATVR